MSYWAAARLLCNCETLALRCLKLAGFEIYCPRIRARRVVRGRKVDHKPLLFPGYLFVAIDLQWHAARWAPGVCGLILDGMVPARVPDQVIAELRSREIRGLIELPPKGGLQPGDRVRVRAGPFQGLAGLYAGQSAGERVLVLLALLGAARQVALPAADVVAVRQAT